MDIFTIGLLIGIVFGEGIYLYVCSTDTKKSLKEGGEWITTKLISFMLGFCISAALMGIYYALKDYLLISLSTLIGLCGIVTFFWANKILGLAVAKGK